jgi:3-oxoacyl-[acyl-carrier protein] reductase
MDAGLRIDFTGKRAVVTGGSRGVGRATALMFARAGADVAISYHSRSGDAEHTVSELRAIGVRAFSHGGDLAVPETSNAFIARVQEELGGVDYFVGNAGIWPPEYVALTHMTDQHWRRTIGANLDSVFYSTRAAARVISDRGRIVLISSTAGQRGEAGHVDDAATKGALIAFVKGLAVELAHRDITVNSIAPGWIDTEMAAEPYAAGGRDRIEAAIPLGRVASADDIAGPVIFLCSNLARHITGEIMNVNGGSVLCG